MPRIRHETRALWLPLLLEVAASFGILRVLLHTCLLLHPHGAHLVLCMSLELVRVCVDLRRARTHRFGMALERVVGMALPKTVGVPFVVRNLVDSITVRSLVLGPSLALIWSNLVVLQVEVVDNLVDFIRSLAPEGVPVLIGHIEQVVIHALYTLVRAVMVRVSVRAHQEFGSLGRLHRLIGVFVALDRSLAFEVCRCHA